MTTERLEKLEWLFYISTQNSTAIPSCATFNPVSAVSKGDPWQGSTTPSSHINKKTIVVSKDFFQGEIADFFAVVEYLRCAGFEIRLCLFDADTQKNTFPVFQGNTDIARLSELAPFQKKQITTRWRRQCLMTI